MLGASLIREHEIGKVLVVAPSGIRTVFCEGTEEDTEMMLEADWVEEQITELSSGAFKYKHVKILRNPARVGIVECLDNDLKKITAS